MARTKRKEHNDHVTEGDWKLYQQMVAASGQTFDPSAVDLVSRLYAHRPLPRVHEPPRPPVAPANTAAAALAAIASAFAPQQVAAQPSHELSHFPSDPRRAPSPYLVAPGVATPVGTHPSIIAATGPSDHAHLAVPTSASTPTSASLLPAAASSSSQKARRPQDLAKITADGTMQLQLAPEGVPEKKGAFSNEEHRMIVEARLLVGGNKWAHVARYIPGRTALAIKKHWHSHLKFRVENDPFEHGDGVHAAVLAPGGEPVASAPPGSLPGESLLLGQKRAQAAVLRQYLERLQSTASRMPTSEEADLVSSTEQVACGVGTASITAGALDGTAAVGMP
eukprot:jgi/Mesvir1/6812/Mv09004-RA.1